MNSGSSTNLTFDANSNMTQDQAGNTLSWDCENRLLKVTYPGSGNYSMFAYDGFGRNVLIQEYTRLVRSKARLVTSLAAAKNFPLLCTLEGV